MKSSKIISILASAVSAGTVATGAFMFWKKKNKKGENNLKHSSAGSKKTEHGEQEEGAEKAKNHAKSSPEKHEEKPNHSKKAESDKKSSHHPTSHQEEKEEKKTHNGKTGKKG